MRIVLGTLQVSISTLAYTLIVATVLLGFLGIIILLSISQPRIRIVGVLLFPFLPSTIFYIIFSLASAASLDTLSVGEIAVSAIVYGVFFTWTLWSVRRDFQNINELKNYYTYLREQELRKGLPPKIGTTFKLPVDDRRYITILEGDIRDLLQLPITKIDVIVNSENDYMMLGRPYDTNMSGALRYLDAKKDEGMLIRTDSLADNLREKLGHQQLPVRIGAIFVTQTTGLAQQGINYIFHVATVTTIPKGGFRTFPEQLPVCIVSCFQAFGRLFMKGEPVETILFPLIGAGNGGLTPHQSAGILIPQIVEQMGLYGGVQTTYIVAYNGLARDALVAVAKEQGLQSKE